MVSRQIARIGGSGGAGILGGEAGVAGLCDSPIRGAHPAGQRGRSAIRIVHRGSRELRDRAHQAISGRVCHRWLLGFPEAHCDPRTARVRQVRTGVHHGGHGLRRRES